MSKYKIKIDSINNIEYRNAVKKLFDVKNGFSDGDLAIEFKSRDSKGKSVPLSTFKGKIIYIDFWATWCVPCLEDIPYLDSLKTKYANNPNIVFISVNMNVEVNDWKKYLLKHATAGIQLYPQQHELDPYNIAAIPRTVVIDKDLKVLAINGPLPSNPFVKHYIDELLNRKN